VSIQLQFYVYIYIYIIYKHDGDKAEKIYHAILQSVTTQKTAFLKTNQTTSVICLWHDDLSANDPPEVNQCLDDACYMAENDILVCLDVHVYGLLTRNCVRHNMQNSRFAVHVINMS
jgi:hypothetical protein